MSLLLYWPNIFLPFSVRFASPLLTKYFPPFPLNHNKALWPHNTLLWGIAFATHAIFCTNPSSLIIIEIYYENQANKAIGQYYILFKTHSVNLFCYGSKHLTSHVFNNYISGFLIAPSDEGLQRTANFSRKRSIMTFNAHTSYLSREPREFSCKFFFGWCKFLQI